jgi:hypothetical protein
VARGAPTIVQTQSEPCKAECVRVEGGAGGGGERRAPPKNKMAGTPVSAISFTLNPLPSTPCTQMRSPS